MTSRVEHHKTSSDPSFAARTGELNTERDVGKHFSINNLFISFSKIDFDQTNELLERSYPKQICICKILPKLLIKLTWEGVFSTNYIMRLDWLLFIYVKTQRLSSLYYIQLRDFLKETMMHIISCCYKHDRQRVSHWKHLLDITKKI